LSILQRSIKETAQLTCEEEPIGEPFELAAGRVWKLDCDCSFLKQIQKQIPELRRLFLRLIHSGRVLEDSWTLEQSHVSDGSFLHCATSQESSGGRVTDSQLNPFCGGCQFCPLLGLTAGHTAANGTNHRV